MKYWAILMPVGVVVIGLDLLLLGTETPHWSMDVLILSTAAYATLWFASRVMLVSRFRRAGLRLSHPSASDAEIIALPAQEKALSQLVNMLMPAGSLDGRIVSLKAPWGGGKSALLRRLQARLSVADTHVPVWIDVWSAESEDDLHQAFHERLLNTPAVFDRCWLALPWLTPQLSLVLRRLVRSVRLAFRNGNLEAEATLDATAPLALTVQPQIEWIVDCLRRQGLATVFILEEIDRATPTVAKLAVTAAQRSFNKPGATVILPYVQEHLWSKVFNPLDPAPADLDSTLETLLHLDMEQQGSAQAVDTPIPQPEHLGLYAAHPVAQADETGSLRPLDPRAPLSHWRRYRLHRHFAALPVTRQTRLLRRFSEKYLGGYQVEMQPYTAADIAQLISEKASLFDLARCTFPALAIADEATARRAVREAIEKYQAGLKVERLRHFEHYYVRLLALDGGKIADVPFDDGVMENLIVAFRASAPDSAGMERIMSLMAQVSGDKERWPLDCATRAVAALAALAAWYTATMMQDEEA